MSTSSLIKGNQRVDKTSAPATRNNIASKAGLLDTISVKLIEYMAKFRDELVQGVTARFPIKSLDIVVRQVFDTTLEKRLEDLLHIVKIPEISLNVQNVSNGEKTDAKIEDYKKKIEELVFAIKSRDRKIMEQKKEIEKLQNTLKLLEKQLNSPFLLDPTSLEEGLHIQKQMQSLMEFMRRITPILNRDLKYKIMFYLKRVGKADINRLSDEFNVSPEELYAPLKELEKMEIIRREENTIYLTDVH
ncbi:MAG: hypothetical protein QXO71_12310 [Candidatus Jordarchaeaceae archaeon]